MEQANVMPMYTSQRQTKLGLATVTIRQEGDLFEAIVSIVDGANEFKANGIFSSAQEAETWAYGSKQQSNDYFSGYKRQGNNLIETKPAKNKIAEILTIEQAITEIQHNYDNYKGLGRSSAVKGDSVSSKEVENSDKLSPEEKLAWATMLIKMGKGKVKNG